MKQTVCNYPEINDAYKELSETNDYETDQIQIHELNQALGKLKNTSPGEDTIMNIFIKKLPEGMKYELLGLFNVSWLSGMVPNVK